MQSKCPHQQSFRSTLPFKPPANSLRIPVCREASVGVSSDLMCVRQQCVAAELRHPCRKRLRIHFRPPACHNGSWQLDKFCFVQQPGWVRTPKATVCGKLPGLTFCCLTPAPRPENGLPAFLAATALNGHTLGTTPQVAYRT